MRASEDPAVVAWQRLELADQAVDFVCRRGATRSILDKATAEFNAAEDAFAAAAPTTLAGALVKLRSLERYVAMLVKDEGCVPSLEATLEHIRGIRVWAEEQQ